MPKVFCAVLECKHNKNNRCKAPEISLSEEGVNTKHQGFKQFWTCNQYEMSEEDKKFYEELKSLEVC